MNFFAAFSGRSGKPDADSVPHLLDDWNSYSKGAPDVEAGGAASSSTDQLFQHVDKANTSLTSMFQSMAKGVTANAAAVMPSGDSFRYSIPTAQQMAYFFTFLAAGGVFLLLSFTIFLPVIIIAPSKFAMSFTLGCLLVMAAFSALRGWKQQVAHMTSKDRLPFSAAYLGSILATLYSALIMKSYLLSLACSGLQVVALLYYIMSYFPGGAQGVRFMLNMFYSAATGLFTGLLKR